MVMSKMAQWLSAAVQKGYRVRGDGVVTGPRGVRKPNLPPSRRYPSINVNIDGHIRAIPVHRLAAATFFGLADILKAGVMVRHLDGDVWNASRGNIALGNHRDNALDRPIADRRRHSRKAWTATIRYRRRVKDRRHGTKTCTRCGQRLPYRSFGPQREMLDGRTTACRACLAAAKAASYRKRGR